MPDSETSDNGGSSDGEEERIAWDMAKEQEFRKIGTKRRKMLLIKRRLEKSTVRTSMREKNKLKLKDLWDKEGPQIKEPMSRKDVKDMEAAKARKRWYRWRVDEQAERRKRYGEERKRKKQHLCSVWEQERARRAQLRKEVNERYRSFADNTPKRPKARRRVPLIAPMRAERRSVGVAGNGLSAEGVVGADGGLLEGGGGGGGGGEDGGDGNDGNGMGADGGDEDGSGGYQQQQQQQILTSSGSSAQLLNNMGPSSTRRSIRRGPPRMHYGGGDSSSMKAASASGLSPSSSSASPGSSSRSLGGKGKIRRPKMFIRNTTNRKLAAKKRAQDAEVEGHNINIHKLHRSKTFLQSFKTGPVMLSKSFRHKLRKNDSFRRRKFEEYDRSRGGGASDDAGGGDAGMASVAE